MSQTKSHNEIHSSDYKGIICDDIIRYIIRKIPRDMTIYEILPRIKLAKKSFLGLREMIFEFNTKDITFFEKAAKYGYREIIGLLLEYSIKPANPQIHRMIRIDPSANNNAIICEASKMGDPDMIKMLLADPRIDPSSRDNYAIRWAALYGRSEAAQLLLADKRVDPSVRDNEAIRNAALRGYLDVCKILSTDVRVDPSANSNQAIRLASQFGYDDVVQLLIKDPRVDASANNYEVIRNALARDHIETVRILLARARDKSTRYPSNEIQCILQRGSVELVKVLLLEDWIDPRIRDHWPIHFSLVNSRPEITECLLDDPRVDERSIVNLLTDTSLTSFEPAPLWIVELRKRKTEMFEYYLMQIQKKQSNDIYSHAAGCP